MKKRILLLVDPHIAAEQPRVMGAAGMENAGEVTEGRQDQAYIDPAQGGGNQRILQLFIRHEIGHRHGNRLTGERDGPKHRQVGEVAL